MKNQKERSLACNLDGLIQINRNEFATRAHRRDLNRCGPWSQTRGQQLMRRSAIWRNEAKSSPGSHERKHLLPRAVELHPLAGEPAFFPVHAWSGRSFAQADPHSARAAPSTLRAERYARNDRSAMARQSLGRSAWYLSLGVLLVPPAQVSTKEMRGDPPNALRGRSLAQTTQINQLAMRQSFLRPLQG